MIVNLRGQKGLESELGKDMFSTVRNQVLAIHCIPCSPQISEFTWLLQQNCQDQFVQTIATMDLQTSQIRQDADRIFSAGNRSPRTIEKVLALLRRAQDLDARFRRLNDKPPVPWRINSIETAGQCGDDLLDQVDMFPGDVYGFESLGSAVLHLATWVCHLMLTTSVLRCMAWLMTPDDYRVGPEYEELVKVARQRVRDIVAMAPYFCKWNGHVASFTRSPVGHATKDSPTKGAAGLIVLWPLFAASASDFADPLQKKYLRGRLRYLANVAGIKQANVFLSVCGPPLFLSGVNHWPY